MIARRGAAALAQVLALVLGDAGGASEAAAELWKLGAFPFSFQYLLAWGKALGA